MKVIDISEATDSLSEYAKQVGKEPIVLTVDGKPLAVLLNVEDEDLETISLSTNPQFLDLIERSRKRRKAEGGISSQEVRRRLGLNSS